LAAKYLFQYCNGATWTTISGVTFDHTLEELNGTEEFIFNLPNTPGNRTIIANNVLLNASYNGSVIFYGLLTGADYTAANLNCKVYNPVFVALKQATGVLNKSYTSVAANSILADIIALTAAQASPFVPAITAGACPTTAVSIKFTNANPFDAMVSLTKALALYYWGDGNALTINIGTRDNTVQTPTIYEQGTKRGVDRSKQIGQVVIKGTDVSGVQIQGSAGTSGALKYFTDSKAADVATLNSLASYKLTLLNNPSTGNPIVVLTDQAYAYKPGQYVSISRADLALSGSFIIQRITKRDVLTTIDVDVPVNQDDVYLTETDQYGDLATYQSQPTTNTPTALTLQGLLHLYHLSEGSGAVATDSSPNGTAKNGTITNGSWVNGAIPGTKVINFSGTGYIDATNTDVLGNTLAIGCWYSPSSLIDHGAMIGKANNFLLEISGTSGAIRFGLHIGGSWMYLTTPTGTISANGRGFALAVYDGSKMYLYVANPQVLNQLLNYSQAQTGSLDSSSADLYLAASGYKGAVAEVMIWGRAPSAQEVQELFFRPLTRIVAKSSGPSGIKNLALTVINISVA
jgi:hypothetical protein